MSNHLYVISLTWSSPRSGTNAHSAPPRDRFYWSAYLEISSGPLSRQSRLDKHLHGAISSSVLATRQPGNKVSITILSTFRTPSSMKFSLGFPVAGASLIKSIDQVLLITLKSNGCWAIRQPSFLPSWQIEAHSPDYLHSCNFADEHPAVTGQSRLKPHCSGSFRASFDQMFQAVFSDMCAYIRFSLAFFFQPRYVASALRQSCPELALLVAAKMSLIMCSQLSNLSDRPVSPLSNAMTDFNGDRFTCVRLHR